MREHFEQYAFWLSIVVAVASFGTTVAVIVHTSKSMSKFELDLAAMQSKNNAQDILIQRAVDAAHEKELACKDMEHQLVMTRMSFKSKEECKDGI